jgi:nanoRNase/pAp phosphatase (c-di-AMP/oligoRNAs hydrolase)
MITEETRSRLASLQQLVEERSSPGRWLVLTHDNPDPDSLASAAALSTLLRSAFRRKVTTAYGGIIGRAENRQMVRTLGLRLSHVRHLNWAHYKHFALVDCQPGTGNNAFPGELTADIVLDHHPTRRGGPRTVFADIRTSYGATATIATEYLAAAGVEIDRNLATALVYAIRTETQDFGREFSQFDRVVHDLLYPRTDLRALARIQTPPLSVDYFRNLHRAVTALQGVSTLVVTHLGRIEQPDIVPEIADLVLRLEGKTWALASGAFGERLYLSMRTTNPRGDAGRLMRRLLGRRGRGGGHGMTAGGWVSLAGQEGGAERLHLQLARRLASYLKKNPDKLGPLRELQAREEGGA